MKSKEVKKFTAVAFHVWKAQASQNYLWFRTVMNVRFFEYYADDLILTDN